MDEAGKDKPRFVFRNDKGELVALDPGKARLGRGGKRPYAERAAERIAKANAPLITKEALRKSEVKEILSRKKTPG
jgi:hypothetical protein